MEQSENKTKEIFLAFQSFTNRIKVHKMDVDVGYTQFSLTKLDVMKRNANTNVLFDSVSNWKCTKSIRHERKKTITSFISFSPLFNFLWQQLFVVIITIIVSLYEYEAIYPNKLTMDCVCVFLCCSNIFVT